MYVLITHYDGCVPYKFKYRAENGYNNTKMPLRYTIPHMSQQEEFSINMQVLNFILKLIVVRWLNIQ